MLLYYLFSITYHSDKAHKFQETLVAGDSVLCAFRADKLLRRFIQN